jgi:hypothetical protein
MTSTIKVNNIQNQCGANIINENSNTITIGASGDTIALASGASQSGFGREGSVNWQTGSLKTTTFTAVSGEGYFINQGSAITMNLPAGSPGAIVAVSDYARNFATYNLTIAANGSEKIGGEAQDAKLDIDGQAATFVYVDSTKGWINVQNAEDTETGISPFIDATGGTITCSGNCRIHTFTGPGTFTVNRIATTCAAVNNLVSYVVVAGGGSGGNAQGGTNGNAGGAGAGGYRELVSPGSPYTGSPLNGYPTPGNRITVTATSFPITVGGGGTTTSGCATGNQGSTSTFSTISSAGGGGGSGGGTNAGSGGSGGGAANAQTKGCGNTPPTTPPQGNNGGATHSPGNPCTVSAGGGGAGAVGANGNPGGPAGPGGAGVTSEITASPVARAGGGGGGGNSGQTGGGTGGTGGGGAGGTYGGPACGVNGTANTGGGGGATASNCGSPATSGLGGSGVVIIRYKFQ